MSEESNFDKPFDERRKGFHEEYRKLVAKWRVDFIAVLKTNMNSIDSELAIIDTSPQKDLHGRGLTN